MLSSWAYLMWKIQSSLVFCDLAAFHHNWTMSLKDKWKDKSVILICRLHPTFHTNVLLFTWMNWSFNMAVWWLISWLYTIVHNKLTTARWRCQESSTIPANTDSTVLLLLFFSNSRHVSNFRKESIDAECAQHHRVNPHVSSPTDTDGPTYWTVGTIYFSLRWRKIVSSCLLKTSWRRKWLGLGKSQTNEKDGNKLNIICYMPWYH